MPNSLRAKISSLRYKGKITEEEYKDLIRKLDGHDKALKTPWIPVTERIPEDGEYVLMDFERNAYVDDHDGPVRKRDIGVGYQFDGFWHVDGCSKVVCLAWQPLPEPYKGRKMHE